VGLYSLVKPCLEEGGVTALWQLGITACVLEDAMFQDTNSSQLKQPTNLLPIGKHTLPELLRLSDSCWLQVFTHRSYYARPTQIFEDPPDDPSPDNELYVSFGFLICLMNNSSLSLEHLGDSIISLVVTQLIYETWPGLRVGPATVWMLGIFS
jgi:dsRNA-specific ribonuclease